MNTNRLQKRCWPWPVKMSWSGNQLQHMCRPLQAAALRKIPSNSWDAMITASVYSRILPKPGGLTPGWFPVFYRRKKYMKLPGTTTQPLFFKITKAMRPAHFYAARTPIWTNHIGGWLPDLTNPGAVFISAALFLRYEMERFNI